jgi:hypothetical protein
MKVTALGSVLDIVILLSVGNIVERGGSWFCAVFHFIFCMRVNGDRWVAFSLESMMFRRTGLAGWQTASTGLPDAPWVRSLLDAASAVRAP